MSEESHRPVKSNLKANFLIGMGLMILYFAITFVFRNNDQATTATSPDFTAAIGKSAYSVRELYRVIPGEELHPLAAAEDFVPAGTLVESYYSNEYMFSIFYEPGQNAIGFQVFDGLEAQKLTLADWKKIGGLFELAISSPPDTKADQQAAWENESGYRIKITRAAASDYAAKMTVVKP
jgi:hypothetical protein